MKAKKKAHEHELVMYENSRADGRTSSKTGLSGGKKKFNEDLIEI